MLTLSVRNDVPYVGHQSVRNGVAYFKRQERCCLLYASETVLRTLSVRNDALPLSVRSGVLYFKRKDAVPSFRETTVLMLSVRSSTP